MYLYNKIIYKIIGSLLCIFIIFNSSLHADTLTSLQKAAHEKQQHHHAKSNYYYFETLSKQPNNTEALYGLAHSYQHLRKNDKALIELKKLLQINPAHEQGLMLSALINIQSQNWNQVLNNAEQVIQINPLNEQAYMYLDSAYSALGDTAAAASAMDRYQQVKAQQ